MTAQPHLFGLIEARRAYTGEPKQLAKSQLVAQHERDRLLPRGWPASPLVPDATDWEQALLEWRIFTALAKRIGPHNSSNRNGHPYGVIFASPTPRHIDLHLDDAAIRALAEAVLPVSGRRVPTNDSPGESGIVHSGLEGLRFHERRGGTVVLTRLGTSGEVRLRKAARAWNTGVAAASIAAGPDATLCWQESAWTAPEIAARAEENFDPDVVLRWSRALRRIGLCRGDTVLDLYNNPPRATDLAGPRPELLLPTRPQEHAETRATTLACLSTRGGSGKTTLTLNVGARLAERGLRVLLVAVSRRAEHSFATYIAGRDAAARPEGVLLHQNQFGGHLRLTTALSGTPVHQLANHIDQLRDQADVLLLDGSHDTRAHLAQAADNTFTCITLVNEMFGIYETTHSARYDAHLELVDRRARRREALAAWLDSGFEGFLDDQDAGPGVVPVDDGDDATRTPDEVDAWITLKQHEFLDQIAPLALSLFPDVDWPSARAGWLGHPDTELDNFDIAEDDITSTFVPHPDADVINNLTRLVSEDGVTDAEVAGRVLCAVATSRWLHPEQQQRLISLGPMCSPPIIPTVVPHSSALQHSSAMGELHVLTRHDPAARALRVIGDTLFDSLAGA